MTICLPKCWIGSRDRARHQFSGGVVSARAPAACPTGVSAYLNCGVDGVLTPLGLHYIDGIPG